MIIRRMAGQSGKATRINVLKIDVEPFVITYKRVPVGTESQRFAS